MKTNFDLEVTLTHVVPNSHTGFGTAKIIGTSPKNKPYAKITILNSENTLADAWIKDKDLELFAVNILKALNSKRLLQGKIQHSKMKKQ